MVSDGKLATDECYIRAVVKIPVYVAITFHTYLLIIIIIVSRNKIGHSNDL